MQIGKLNLNSQKIERNISVNENKAEKRLATNPFGVSFKGNVIQADVFECENKKTASESITEKGKVFASALVSGINSFNESFKSRMNAIVSFGKKVSNNISETFDKIANTEVTFNLESIKNTLFPDRQYSVKNLSNRPVSELKTMWQDLEAIEE